MKNNKIFMIVLFCLIIVQHSFAAERVFYEDCEDTSYSEHFLEEQFGTSYQSYWDELISEISQSGIAHSGNYSATYNPFQTGNPHARLGVGNTAYGNTSNFSLSSVDARYWYFRWYQRWEDGSNSGANKNLYINSQPVGDYVFVIEKEGSVSFHIFMRDHNTYGLVFNKWASHSGGSLDDETWHKMEVFIDSGTTGGSNGAYWVKIDDITLSSGNGYNFNGTIHSNPIENIGWPSNTSNASGSQQIWVDDLEIWIGGMPTDINPPKNLRKVPTP